MPSDIYVENMSQKRNNHKTIQYHNLIHRKHVLALLSRGSSLIQDSG